MQTAEYPASQTAAPQTRPTRLRRILKSICRILLAVTGVVAAVWLIIAQPTFTTNDRSHFTVDKERLKRTVLALSSDFYPRSWEHRQNLDRCADYIMSHFSNATESAHFQVFPVYGSEYRNVIAKFGQGKGSKIIVGAHYDSWGDTPGADDNASGVAALIELAHLLGENPPEREVELVAYSLEEPPFFRTPDMGSAVHAASVSYETITGVIVLETMGCFSTKRGSQSYPSRLLRLIYPSRGNFIAVVGPWNQGAWIKDIKTGMKGTSDLPVYSIRAPAAVPGIDLSDHMNYWPHGINAVMITDTAFYRNKAYHKLNDTADSLDYAAMSKAVVGVFEAIRGIKTDTESAPPRRHNHGCKAGNTPLISPVTGGSGPFIDMHFGFSWRFSTNYQHQQTPLLKKRAVPQHPSLFFIQHFRRPFEQQAL